MTDEEILAKLPTPEEVIAAYVRNNLRPRAEYADVTDGMTCAIGACIGQTVQSPYVPSDIKVGTHFAILTNCGRYDGYDNDGKAWQIEIFATKECWELTIAIYERDKIAYVPVILKRPAITTTVKVEVFDEL